MLFISFYFIFCFASHWNTKLLKLYSVTNYSSALVLSVLLLLLFHSLLPPSLSSALFFSMRAVTSNEAQLCVYVCACVCVRLLACLFLCVFGPCVSVCILRVLEGPFTWSSPCHSL